MERVDLYWMRFEDTDEKEGIICSVGWMWLDWHVLIIGKTVYSSIVQYEQLMITYLLIVAKPSVESFKHK